MRITSRGQVTIPQAIREELGLLPNTHVEFSIERGALVLRPKRGAPTRATRLISHLKTHGTKMRMSSRQLLSLLREEPEA